MVTKILRADMVVNKGQGGRTVQRGTKHFRRAAARLQQGIAPLAQGLGQLARLAHPLQE